MREIHPPKAKDQPWQQTHGWTLKDIMHKVLIDGESVDKLVKEAPVLVPQRKYSD